MLQSRLSSSRGSQGQGRANFHPLHPKDPDRIAAAESPHCVGLHQKGGLEGERLIVPPGCLRGISVEPQEEPG